MTTMQIECPKCRTHIEIDKVLEMEVLERHQKVLNEKVQNARAQLEVERKKIRLEKQKQDETLQKIQEEYEVRYKADKLDMAKTLRAELKKESIAKLESLEIQLAEKEKKLTESQRSELELLHQKKELENARRSHELDVEKKVQAQLYQLREQAVMESQKAVKAVQEEVKVKEETLRKAQENELALRREKAELTAKMETMELEVARRMASERQAVRTEALKTADEQHRFQLQDKEKTITDMKKVIEELNTKVANTSQQHKGEVAELEVEKQLQASYPSDIFDPVPKGISGADLIQTVQNNWNQPCGKIIIEIKRTKGWSNEWIPKLKSNQQSAKAELAVLITSALPGGKEHYCCQDDVWIVDYDSYRELMAVLRMHLIEISRVLKAKDNQGNKMHEIYNYVKGPEFRQKVEGVLTATRSLKDDLSKEKETATKFWARREKAIEAIVTTTAVLAGDVEGILGLRMEAVAFTEAGEGSDQKKSA